MPKASKKKAAKEADFKKTKVKLGKGKKQASNATDTSFKARSIAIPNQTPLDRALLAPAGEPITSGGLTLDEVLLRFRHPNSGVRRESLGGVKEILLQHPKREVGRVCRVVGGAVSDEDAGVRKALLSFFAWYLTTLDEATLTPHLPLLLLQTSSALSHIFPEIRLDASRLVYLFLDQIPKHVISSWPASDSTILEGLRLTLGLGGDKGSSSTQSGRLGTQGKLVALRTILAFVRAALDGSPSDSSVDAEIFGKVFGEDVAGPSKASGKGKEREMVVAADLVDHTEGFLAGIGKWGVALPSDEWELGRLETETSLAGKGAETDAVAQLYTQLHPLLLATFLEAAPTAFSPSSSSLTATDETAVELCTISAALTEILARHSLDSHTDQTLDRTVRSNASDFLKRMAAWFPFSSPSLTTPTSTGVSPAFELALIYSRLAILLAPRPKPLAYPKGKKEVGWKARVRATEESWKAMRLVGKSKGKNRSADGWALDEVSEWIVEVLSPNVDALAPSLTPQAYTSLLSLILPLLLLPPTSDVPTSVGTAFLNHLTRQGASSQIRSAGDRFLMSLILHHETRFISIPFLVTPDSPLRPLIQTWLESLPKSLWELGIKNPGSSMAILDFLLTLGLRGKESFDEGYSLVHPETFGVIASRLGPWFYLDHPAKGGIKGPWIRLDQPIQRLGLDVAYIWSQGNEKLVGAVSKAIEGSIWAVQYWSSRTD